MWFKNSTKSNITLENLKDRATVIFKIYLQLGHNYYVELEDHTDQPLVIKPFEAYQSNYEQIICYAAGMRRIKIDKLISDKKVKKHIVLSTTSGKYKVTTDIKLWDPIGNLFKNYMTAIIKPKRLIYKEKSYGINTKYLVRLQNKNGHEQIVPLRADNENSKIFMNFDLTKEALDTKDNLSRFFEKQKKRKAIEYNEIEIIEYQKESHIAFKLKDLESIEAKPHGFLYYRILGRLFTLMENRKMRINNRNRKGKSKT